MRTESGTGRGGAGETAARTHRRMTSRRLLADYHINPNPGKIAQTRQYLLQVLFFYFYTNTSRKKKYKSTEVGKVAENQQLKAVLFWTFQECGVVRTVQEYGDRQECGNSAEVNALMHNEISG